VNFRAEGRSCASQGIGLEAVMSKATLLFLMFMSYAVTDPKGFFDTVSPYVHGVGTRLSSILDVNRIFPTLFNSKAR
jgi:hypothetical protein